MLDIKLIRENPEIVIEDLKKRDRPDLLKKIDELKELDAKWREELHVVEKLKHRRNVLSKEISELKKQGKDASEKLRLVKEIPDKIAAQDAVTEGIYQKMTTILKTLPNILHETVPVGADDTENVTIKEVGKKPNPKFKIKSHVDMLEGSDLADTFKAGNVAGSRFYYLKADLVMLDFALQKFALDLLHKKGFILMYPPLMLRREAYETMVSMDDFEEVMYKIDDEDLYLIATSEHPIGVYHLNEVIEGKR